MSVCLCVCVCVFLFCPPDHRYEQKNSMATARAGESKEVYSTVFLPTTSGRHVTIGKVVNIIAIPEISPPGKEDSRNNH